MGGLVAQDLMRLLDFIPSILQISGWDVETVVDNSNWCGVC